MRSPSGELGTVSPRGVSTWALFEIGGDAAETRLATRRASRSWTRFDGSAWPILSRSIGAWDSLGCRSPTDAAASAASLASDRWRSNLDTLSKSFFPNTRVLNHVSTRALNFMNRTYIT